LEKKIEKVTALNFKQQAPGLSSVDMFHSQFNFEPYLVFTEFHMSHAVFGPHAHAGVSVMTYMMPDSAGSFLNRDSLGDSSIIEPGGIHVTQAGSGVKHDEVPTVEGKDCHGFQIWINHADKDRLVAPKAFHAANKDVPEVRTDIYVVRVLQGNFENTKAAFELVTKTNLFHVTLQPYSSISFDASEMAFIYLMEAKLTIANREIKSRSLVNFEKQGSKIIVKANENVANFMFASGTPHNEPIVYGGPFVMTTAQQMADTKLRLQRGEMGALQHL
jgi:quercetin 2,3-dioxygenase